MPKRFLRVVDRIGVAAHARTHESPAAVGVAGVRVKLERQLEVAEEASLQRIHNQVGPAPIGLHGRGRVQFECLGEILEPAARILAQLGARARPRPR